MGMLLATRFLLGLTPNPFGAHGLGMQLAPHHPTFDQEIAVTESERNADTSNGKTRKYAPALKAMANTVDEIKRLDEQLLERVRERPLVAMGIALAAGYFLGRIFSRWG